MSDKAIQDLSDDVLFLKQDRNERVAEFEALATTIRAMLLWIRTLPHGSESLALIREAAVQMLQAGTDPLLRAASLGALEELFGAVEMGATGKRPGTN
jgi:hypothetical protein